MFRIAAAGLLTRYRSGAFPSVGTVAKECRNAWRNLQQRELLPVFTAFPFNPMRPSGAPMEPLRGKSTLFSADSHSVSAKKAIFVLNMLTMELSVRQVTEVTDSLAEAFARLMPQLSPQLAAPAAERLQALVGSPSTALFAAGAAGTIVGVLTLVWYDVPSGRKAWIEDVVVDTAARGVGAGEALVRAALEHAAAVGAGKVMLTSNPARKAAHRLYEKVGFKEAETTLFACKIDVE